MRVLHLVTVEGSERFVEDCNLRDGKVSLRRWDNESEFPEYYDEWVACEIDKTFLVNITASFIMNDDHAYTVSGSMREINTLAYFYSVTIIEKPATSRYYGTNIYPDNAVIHSEAGVRSTRFDMYSYHFNEPEFHYDESRLEYEVWESLEFEKLLNSPA